MALDASQRAERMCFCEGAQGDDLGYGCFHDRGRRAKWLTTYIRLI